MKPALPAKPALFSSPLVVGIALNNGAPTKAWLTSYALDFQSVGQRPSSMRGSMPEACRFCCRTGVGKHMMVAVPPMYSTARTGRGALLADCGVWANVGAKPSAPRSYLCARSKFFERLSNKIKYHRAIPNHDAIAGSAAEGMARLFPWKD